MNNDSMKELTNYEYGVYADMGDEVDYIKIKEEHDKEYLDKQIAILTDLDGFDNKLKLCLEHLPDTYENIDSNHEVEDDDIDCERDTIDNLFRMYDSMMWLSANWKEYQYVGSDIVYNFYSIYINLKSKQDFLALPFETIASILTQKFLNKIYDRDIISPKQFKKKIKEHFFVKHEEHAWKKFIKRMNKKLLIDRHKNN